MSQYKYEIFFLALFLIVPMLVLITLKNRRLIKILMAMVIVFTLFLQQFFDINFISMEGYRGTVRGFEVTVVDLIILVLFFVVILSRNIKKSFIIPGTWPNLLYIFCSILSIHFSIEQIFPVYGYFVIFQYVRGLILYWTFYHFIKDESDYQFLINMLIISALISSIVALQHRYVFHLHRIGGLFGHPNILGTYSNMLAIFFLVIYRERIVKRNMLVLFVALISAGTTVLTISRGSIIALGIGMTLLLSTIFLGKAELSAKKISSSIIIIMAISIIWFRAGDRILDRWITPNPAGDALRAQLNRIAVKFADENIFGCGLNNFSRAARAYIPNAPPVHGIYTLTLGEMGYIGLMAFIMVWARFIFIGIKQFFVKKKSIINSCVKGLALACLILLINSTQDDHPRRTAIMYISMICWAYIAKGENIIKKNSTPI